MSGNAHAVDSCFEGDSFAVDESLDVADEAFGAVFDFFAEDVEVVARFDG